MTSLHPYSPQESPAEIVEPSQIPRTLLDKWNILLPIIGALRLVYSYCQKSVCTIRRAVRSEIEDVVDGVVDAVEDTADTVLASEDLIARALIPSQPRSLSSFSILQNTMRDLLKGALAHCVPVFGAAICSTAERLAIEDIEEDVDEVFELLDVLLRDFNDHKSVDEKRCNALEEKLRILEQKIRRLECIVQTQQNEMLLLLQTPPEPKPTQFTVQDVRRLAQSDKEWWYSSNPKPNEPLTIMNAIRLREREPYLLPSPLELEYFGGLDVSSSGIVSTQSGLSVGYDFIAHNCPRLRSMEGYVVIGHRFSLRGNKFIQRPPDIHVRFIDGLKVFDCSNCPNLHSLGEFSEHFVDASRPPRVIRIHDLFLVDTAVTTLPDNILPRYVHMLDVGQEVLAKHCFKRCGKNNGEGFHVVKYTQAEWEQWLLRGY